MPGVNPPNNNPLPYALAEMNNRISALEKQQQLVITNRKGQPVMVTGMQPGSNPVRWGIGIVNRNFRQPIAFFGDTEGATTQTGTVALNFYAADGKTVLVKVNTTGLFYAGSGTGGFTRVSPPQEDYINTELTTSSTSYVTLGGPSVTVNVSNAGRALVLPSSVIGIDGGTSTVNKQGFVGVQLDGGAVAGEIGVSQSPDKSNYISGIQVTAANAYMWKGLAFGTHNFKCVYESKNGQAVHFSNNSLIVIPY